MNLTVLPVSAESTSVKAGAFTLTGDNLTEGTDYTYEAAADGGKYGGVLTIRSSNPVVISNTDTTASTMDRIVVASGITADITIQDVKIDVSSVGEACAFEIKQETMEQATTVNLTLSGENILKSGYIRGGLEVTVYEEYDFETGMETPVITKTNSVLTIDAVDGGTLYARGGDYGAGIGSRMNWSTGTVTINGGTIVAEGGNMGAGIGCANPGSGGIITIHGGSVTATGKGWAPGIGGVNDSDESITITGGYVVATGGEKAACIGGRYTAPGGSITISGGTVITTGGANGIGDGAELDNDRTPSVFSTGSDGNAIIKTSNITDISNQDGWSGVVFEGTEGTIYGNPTLTDVKQGKLLRFRREQH